ncbi:MAG: hypothetical protein KAH38_04480 [Candidatus Hydrogenedentes bacterium]|nr:hypothetical protein [Candidatus Hydrogenedentota bacterium]
MSSLPDRLTDTLTPDALIAAVEAESMADGNDPLDILSLDDNWLRLPQVSFKWHRLSNMAAHCIRVHEAKLKDALASTYLEIREEYIASGGKCTEALLANEVAATETIIKLKEDLLYLQYIGTLLVSKTKSMDDTRRALEGLTSLHTTHYFSNTDDNPIMKEVTAHHVQETAATTLAANKRLRRVRTKYEENTNE